MAVFVELVTDAFEDRFNEQSSIRQVSRRAGLANARRPFRGIEIKTDTYALLKVISADGQDIPLFDSSGENGRSEDYTNFLLQSVVEGRMEKSQIVETFGEPYIFFFGEQPRFIDCSAILLNTHDFNWRAEFWANYERYLRGTKLVEMGARCYMFYDDNVVEGYIMHAQASENANEPNTVSLQFRMFVTNHSNVSLIGSSMFPTRPGVIVPAVPDSTGDFADVDEAIAETQGRLTRMSSLRQEKLLAYERAKNTKADSAVINDASNGLMQAANAEATARSQLSQLVERRQYLQQTTRRLPYRSNISDNADEWAGARGRVKVGPVTKEGPGGEVPDFHTAVLDSGLDSGADLDSPKALKSVGASPTAYQNQEKIRLEEEMRERERIESEKQKQGAGAPAPFAISGFQEPPKDEKVPGPKKFGEL